MQIFLITILGLLIRLINIVKPEGLWNDEYVSWMTASVHFGSGFWSAVFKQCHMPLYYLYLKPFVNCNDLVLRLTSVVPSVLAIPVMFLIGKHYSKKTGYFCASITAVLPFLAYYAQEVRFYSLVFLLSTIILLAAIKIIDSEKTTKYKIIYIISAAALLLTHHLGLIYLFLMTSYIFYKKGYNKFLLLLFTAITLLILTPIGIKILAQAPSSQWWEKFSYTNIMFLFSDFFSPILTNNIAVPKVFYYHRNILYMSLMTFPTLIALIGILKGAWNKKGFASVALITIIIMTALSVTGNVVFITKYLIEILPILILIMVIGLENKYWNILLVIFICIQLLSVLTPYHTTKIFRSEGHRIVGEILNASNPDKVLFTYYAPDRFYRYWNKEGKAAYYISKINRFDYVETPELVLKNIKSGDKTAFVFLNTVSFIPPENINPDNTSDIPEMFLTFSKIKNKLIREINDNYKNYQVYKQGSWTIITATKK